MKKKLKKAVVIVAGGSGKRMQSTIPKQFLRLCNKPVLFHTLERFHGFDPEMEIILVLPSNQIEYWNCLIANEKFGIPHKVVSGGAERFFSVKNGTELLSDDYDLIAVHDGVRPLISKKLIDSCFQTAAKVGTAIPAIHPTETVRYGTNTDSRLLDRNLTYLIQTPQVFRNEILRNAYNVDFSPEFTDDASVVEHSGVNITLVEGDRINIKITSPSDLSMCEFLLKTNSLE